MIKIGEYNKLRIARFVDFGAYLTDDATPANEVLLPAKYLDGDWRVGTEVDVFVYTDSEDRPIATTEHPFAKVGEFAYLEVVQVNRFGAFIDWGLAKNLLVPFGEQRIKMREGGFYLVYIYVDDATKRVVGSAKIDKFLGNVYPDYGPRQKVDALVYEHTPIGYRAIVDNKHKGIIYANEVFAPLTLNQTVTAYIKKVRDDGKIDLTLTAPGVGNRINGVSDEIMRLLADGEMPLNDHSSPDDIQALLHCSKKDFKRAIGALYKDHKITIDGDKISLVES